MTNRKNVIEGHLRRAEELWSRKESGPFPGHDAKIEDVMKGLTDEIEKNIKDLITFLMQIPG